MESCTTTQNGRYTGVCGAGVGLFQVAGAGTGAGALGQLADVGALQQAACASGQLVQWVTGVPGWLADGPGEPVDMPGQLVDMSGQLVNMSGQLVNMSGQLANMPGQLVDTLGQSAVGQSAGALG